MKKLAIVGTVGLPSNYGGFETLSEYIVKFLADKFEITVYCSSKRYDEQIEQYNGAKLKYVNKDANGKESILYDILSLKDAVKYNDIIFLFGVSGAIYLPYIRRKNVRIITNIDGIEWRRDKWGSIHRKLLKYFEALAVKYSNVIISDNKAIVDYVKNEYKKDSIQIEYGGDHASRKILKEKDFQKYPFLHNDYCFSVCRIEPENNVHVILKAFEKLDESLVFVGNWYNSEYGCFLKSKYDSYRNMYLLDPIYELEELDIIRSNCKLYIHGHSAGGTNPSLVEAMSLGLSVIAYDVVFNRYTTESRADFFSDEKSLIYNITEFRSNGKSMKEIASKRYLWSIITEKYKDIAEK